MKKVRAGGWIFDRLRYQETSTACWLPHERHACCSAKARRNGSGERRIEILVWSNGRRPSKRHQVPNQVRVDYCSIGRYLIGHHEANDDGGDCNQKNDSDFKFDRWGQVYCTYVYWMVCNLEYHQHIHHLSKGSLGFPRLKGTSPQHHEEVWAIAGESPFQAHSSTTSRECACPACTLAVLKVAFSSIKLCDLTRVCLRMHSRGVEIYTALLCLWHSGKLSCRS